MLTNRLTDEEKRDEIFKDREELQQQLSKIRERADYRRAVKKAVSFPFNYTTHYKSSRGNRYTIIITPTDKKRGGLENPIFSLYTKMETEEGCYMLRYDMILNNVTIFTPHFFSRYRERYLKANSLSQSEVIKTFAERNPNLSNTTNEGTEKIGVVKDGYIYLKGKDRGLTIAVTFISFDMLREEQRAKAEELLKVIKDYEKSVTENLYI